MSFFNSWGYWFSASAESFKFVVIVRKMYIIIFTIDIREPK